MSDKVILSQVENMIYLVRGQRVMLDSDLAGLYEVETKALTRQVRRNQSRFPEDFLIEPDSKELEDLRRQFGAANPPRHWNHKRRTSPMLFTENGVAMLSSVLNSERAIHVNISIMRIFTKLRSFLHLEKDLRDRMDKLQMDTGKLFQMVFKCESGFRGLTGLSPNNEIISVVLKNNY
jgi:hypothetical protein